MDLRGLLADPELAPSCAWAACRSLFGGDVADWEPDTFRIELGRKGVDVRPALMAKVLGAQTVVTTTVWANDHDALFAFALACEGVPAAADAFHHPTPEQLAWAIREIRRLHPLPADLANEGFDPDEIDPAVACVLLDDGLCVAPDELGFVQDVLDRMAYRPDGFVERVAADWRRDWSELGEEALHGKAQELDLASPHDLQLHHLAAIRQYVLRQERQRDDACSTLALR